MWGCGAKVDDCLSNAFETQRRSFVILAQELEIRRVPMRVKCNAYGEEFDIDAYDPSTWLCPACGAKRDNRFVSGTEFYIDSITVTGEVPARSTTVVATEGACRASTA